MNLRAHSILKRSFDIWNRSSGLRLASSSSNPLPFPVHPNPTPHQIFHLPPGASQNDVKSRYYDLVRIYHPDSPIARSVPSHVAQARFQAISRAYNILRGKPVSDDPSQPADAAGHVDLKTAVWKARQRQKADLEIGTADEGWKDKLLIGGIILTMFAVVAQMFSTRREAMADAVRQKRQSIRDAQQRKRLIDDSALLAAAEPENTPKS